MKKIETSHHGFRDYSALGELASGGLGPVLDSLVQERDGTVQKSVMKMVKGHGGSDI